MEVGKRVIDKESRTRDPALVLEILEDSIDEYIIEDTEKTVSEHNPDYPPEDKVIKVVFEERLEKNQINSLRNGKNIVNEIDDPIYFYPQSRLIEYKEADIWFDGACEPRNPGGYGTYGFVIKTEESKIKDRGYIGKGEGITNHVAEYNALIEALKEARNHLGIASLDVYGDSELVIKQMKGKYRVKDSKMTSLNRKAKTISNIYHRINFIWIPREKNKEADSLSILEYEERAYGERKQKAKEEDMSVNRIEGSKFIVKKYIVDLEKQTCTCLDNKMRNSKCKHIFKAEMEYENQYNVQ